MLPSFIVWFWFFNYEELFGDCYPVPIVELWILLSSCMCTFDVQCLKYYGPGFGQDIQTPFSRIEGVRHVWCIRQTICQSEFRMCLGFYIVLLLSTLCVT